MIFIWIFVIFLSIAANKRIVSRQHEVIYLSNYLSSEEINFIMANNINIEDVKPYLEFKNFIIYNFYSYEKLRNEYNLTYLESLNYYNNPNYYHFYKNPKKALFLDQPLTLVNKSFYLEPDFIPDNLINAKEYQLPIIEKNRHEVYLKEEVLEKLKLMIDDAKKKNIELVIFSGYRSYSKQSHLYYYVYQQDDTFSARPGFSEHQTGYAVDISTPNYGLISEFQNSNSHKWLISNAHKYGFILRYPKGKEHLTGYIFEPWHFRYVGSIASFLYEQDLTLEEYIFSYHEI